MHKAHHVQQARAWHCTIIAVDVQHFELPISSAHMSRSSDKRGFLFCPILRLRRANIYKFDHSSYLPKLCILLLPSATTQAAAAQSARCCVSWDNFLSFNFIRETKDGCLSMAIRINDNQCMKLRRLLLQIANFECPLTRMAADLPVDPLKPFNCLFVLQAGVSQSSNCAWQASGSAVASI